MFFFDNSAKLWDIDKKAYEKLTKKFLSFENLKIVRIFGSHVTGEAGEFSDIDLLCEGTYTPEEYVYIQNNIRNLEIPYVIDMFDIFMPNRPFIYRNYIRSNIFYKRSDYIEDDYKPLFNLD